MKLKYVNAAAKTQDIQVPVIQVEPMIHLHVYEVDNKVGLALLESDPKRWKEVLPKEEKVKVKKEKKEDAPDNTWNFPLIDNPNEEYEWENDDTWEDSN